MRDAVALAELRAAAARTSGGTNSSESGSARLRPDPLHLGVEVPGVDEPRAARVRRGRDRPHERRGASARAIIRMFWPGWTFVPTSTISLA